ncbi:MAG: Rab family GTPase [Promethearchaeota archaeon]
MAEEYDYLIKCIIVGDKGVGITTLIKYLTGVREQQTLEATKKQYDKKIDEYQILRGKTRGRFKRLIKRKTTLEKRTPIFNSHRLSTGAELCTKTVKLRGNNAKLQIWILSPSKRFNSLRQLYVLGSNGAIIMYDITNMNSLNRISEWSQVIREKDGNIPILLAGNKIDLEDLREISIDQINKIIEDLQLSAFMEISSKTGENVELMFERFTQLIINFFENRN